MEPDTAARPPEHAAPHEQLRELFAEFHEHIAGALRHELSHQTAELRQIIQQEGKRQSQSSNEWSADSGGGTDPNACQADKVVRTRHVVVDKAPVAFFATESDGSDVVFAMPKVSTKQPLEQSEFTKMLQTSTGRMSGSSSRDTCAYLVDRWVASMAGGKAWNPDSASRMASDVSHLSLVSTSIQRALRIHVVTRHLGSHIFFGVWCQLDMDSLATFCNSCVEDLYYTAGDICFREKADGRTMFFIKIGSLTYLPGADAPEARFPDEDPRLACEANAVATEVAMWLKWVHLGTMMSSTTTEVLTINTDVWLKDFGRNDTCMMPVRDYAIAFCAHVMEPDVVLSDLAYVIDYHAIMFALPLSSRMVLSEALFVSLNSARVSLSSGSSGTQAPGFLKPHARKRQMQKLRDEVYTGKACVGIVDQALARLVFVVAIRIYRRPNIDVEDCNVDVLQAVKTARFLVKVGEVSHSTAKVTARCVLPGTSRKECETTVAAMHRVVTEDFDAMGMSIEWHPSFGKTSTHSFKDSPTFGLKTMYSRTVFMGFVGADYVGPTAPAPCQSFAPQVLAAVNTCWCRKRSRSAHVHETQKHVAEILRGLPDVVVCEREDCSTFYAWLLDEEFQVLGGSDAKPILEQWVGDIARARGDSN